MEESKEGGVLVGSVSETFEVAGDDAETLVESMDTEVQGQGQAGDDTQTLVESMDTEVQGQGQASDDTQTLVESMDTEVQGQGWAGDDNETLVESLDTEVQGQGRAGDDNETLVESLDTEVQGQAQIEGSSAEEVLEEGELCDEGDVKDSGGDVLGLGTETGVEDSSMISDPSESQNQGADVTREESVEGDKKTTEDKGVVTDDKGSVQLESINDKARDDSIGTRADGAAEAVSSTEVESQNLQAVEVVAKEGDANEIVDAQAVGGEEPDATKEAANVKCEEYSIGTLVEEGVDRMEVVDGGVDMVQDIKTLEADNPDNGILNSVTATKVGEYNQATEEEAAASAKQEEAGGDNSLDGTANNSNREQISVTKGVCGEPEREDVNGTGAGSLDEHKIVTSEGEFAVLSNQEFTCSKVEDSIPLSQPVQVTRGLEIAAVDDKALSNSEKEGLDRSMAHDDAHVDSKLEPSNDFDKQVTQAKQVGFHGKSETEVQQRQSKAETVNGDGGIHFQVLVDATSGQSSPVVVGDKIVVNSSPSVEISDYVDMDGMLSCSGKEQNLTAETVSGGTVADAQAIDGDAEVASQPIETEERPADNEPCVIQGGTVEETKILCSGARDQPLKSGETVDESAAHDYLEVNSNVGKGPKVKVVEQAIDEDEFYPDFKLANKRRAVDSFADDSVNQEGRKTISFAKVSLTTPSTPKHSFKIGECIRRVAPSILKCDSEKLPKLDGSSDRLSGDGFDASLRNVEDAEKIEMIVPVEYSSLDELLSKLHLVARDPFGGYEFLNVIASFFVDFRNSVVLEQYLATEKAGSKRGMPHPLGVSPETFEFEDMSDTYWTDRIIQNGSEEQPSRKSRKREIDPIQGNPRSYSRRRYSYSNDAAAGKPIGYVGENAPAELVMNFSEVDTVPSEMNLNRMFKHFGPLKESETEVDKEASRARVVFKRCSDAEAAFNSAGKFGIFGPVAVNYQLNYTVLPPFRNPLVATTQGDEDTSLLLEY